LARIVPDEPADFHRAATLAALEACGALAFEELVVTIGLAAAAVRLDLGFAWRWGGPRCRPLCRTIAGLVDEGALRAGATGLAPADLSEVDRARRAQPGFPWRAFALACWQLRAAGLDRRQQRRLLRAALRRSGDLLAAVGVVGA
jgi:hypothetical protein